MQAKVFEVINELIARANELNAITKAENVTPLEAGRATWERKGILDALRIICEKTGVYTFLDLSDDSQI